MSRLEHVKGNDAGACYLVSRLPSGGRLASWTVALMARPESVARGVRSRRLQRTCAVSPAAQLPHLVLFVWQLCAALAAAVEKKASFNVRAQLLSGWKRTPAAAQSLEWFRDLASVGEQAAFLRHLVAAGGKGETVTTEIAAAEKLLRSASARTFHELLVRNHFYSPRVEAIRTLERRDRGLFGNACEEGVAWALLWYAGVEEPTAACDAQALRNALAKEAVSANAGGTAAPSQAASLAGSPGSLSPHKLDISLRRSTNGVSRRMCVLYGAVSAEGLRDVAPLLAEIDSLPEASDWTAVFRYADGPVGPEGPGADDLTGFGFELAIKSSEYKTHEDEKNEGDNAEQPKEGDAAPPDADLAADADEDDLRQLKESETKLDGPLEISGLLFHVLLDKHPALRSRLWSFKEQLEAEQNTDAVLKAWEIKDIGLQATARIKAASNPLLTLMRISQDFPAHVVRLSKTVVPESLRKGHHMLRRMMRNSEEVFSVNNRLVQPDHSDLSVFPMMKTLHPFFVGVERMTRIGLNETTACEMLKESSGSASPQRLDWRSNVLPRSVYLVTKDKKSQRWGASLQNLMYVFPGSLAPVRLPIYKLVFVFDPADVDDLKQALSLLKSMPMPMSVHFVMAPSARTDSVQLWDEQVLGARPEWMSGATDVGVGSAGGASATTAITAVFGNLLHRAPSKARTFLKNMVEWCTESGYKEGERISHGSTFLTALKGIWEKLSEEVNQQVVWQEIVEGMVDATNSYLANATRYVSALGVPVPSMLINGKLLLKSAYEGSNSIIPTIGHEQQILQKGVYTGQVRQPEDIEEYLASDGMLPAFHEDITPEVARRGGEEGMREQRSGNSATYIQWPTEPFQRLSFLQSCEEDLEQGSHKGVNFYHIVVLRSLKQAYLLHVFAAHLLNPDRSTKLAAGGSAASFPHFASRWSVLVDLTTAAEAEGLQELRACVRGVLMHEASNLGEVYSLNRQKLMVLKFLGIALPAAAGAASVLPPQHVKLLCDLAVSKKVDPDVQASMRNLIANSRAGGQDAAASADEQVLLAAATPLETVSDGAVPADGAVWVCNGRRIALATRGQRVSPRHVQTLEHVEAQYDTAASEEEEQEQEQNVDKAAPAEEKALGQWLEDAGLAKNVDGLIAAIRSEALSSGQNQRFTQPVQIFESAPASFRLHLPPARPELASPIKVYGIVDPLSATAQSASALLALFSMAFNAEVNLVLNPMIRHSEYPLKRYYREVIHWPDRLSDGTPSAELEGGEVGNGRAELVMATQHTLTAAVHALPTWLVTAYQAEHDMDNLRLVDVGDGRTCDTTYQLRQLYVEGQAFILGEDGWPVAAAKGLQIDVVGKGSRDAPDDTVIMENLGYFQLHGNPGFYEVALKNGLSNDTFIPASMEDVEVTSYFTPPYQLRVSLRPGKIHDDLFEQGKGPNSGAWKKRGRKSSSGGPFSRFLGSFSSMWSGQKDDTDSKSTDKEEAVSTVTPEAASGELPTVHIFTVASGHLYEKLLSIMILSVKNHTKCPLHFWFIDNFLSPKFKAFIPHMAERYNFDFDFVTYKWPSWLNGQSEKQRLIWAYKILFLDVLFPMDVPKVIFIDADQVVRADVKELWEIDLHGKVYGFVPMGNSNLATEGFRFWKQGYWKSHLRDLPYHISALFVVDLVEFRRTAIGDALRSIYNQLSRDPNSLANLDQDLPNFAQHQIPIFSLPQEWLWCETWCSQESKPQAKTIDLCQNPLTKEPKIVMAKRIISEWQGFHDEVLHLQRSVALLTEPESSALTAGKPEL